MIVYHFAAKTLRDGSALPRKGDDLPHREAVLCRSGWHGSTNIVDALMYAPGSNLCLRELRGVVVEGDDKACGSEARQLTAYVDARPLLVEFAQWCAERAKGHADAANAAEAYADDAAADAAAAAANAADAAAADATRADADAYTAERKAQRDWLGPRAAALIQRTTA